jgi:cyclase
VIRAAAAVLVLACASGAGAQDALQTIKVAENVFAILQPFDNRFNDSNAVLIVGPSSAIVIDSQENNRSAQAVIAEIRKLTDKPVRQVIATHWHGDHFQGSDAYRDAYPGVEFVAHATAAVDMRERATKQRDEDLAALKREIPAAEDRLARGVNRRGEPLTDGARKLAAESLERGKRRAAALESVHFVFPTVTLGERTTWYVADSEVRLMHFRGHTAGDLAIYLPRERVLITGDLVDDLPFLGHGFPADYLKTLEALEALEWDTMVPGHGQVRKGKDHLRAVSEVFGSIYLEVKKAVGEGLTLEQTKARLNLAPYRARLSYGDARAGRAFDEFVPAAIERMFEELQTR